MRKVLFICSQNRLRSPTAEQVFSMDSRLDVRSAGLDKDAINTISSDDLEWADIIFVMEKTHRNKLSKKFKQYVRGKRVISLNIPDEYDYMDPILIQLLKISVPKYLETY
ncbi:MAG: phosphotyrosine protein phosphatase [Planctomycetes bacterium]|nr:phosphotyrosine protein phosphatase [Planctomycetota bacterium]